MGSKTPVKRWTSLFFMTYQHKPKAINNITHASTETFAAVQHHPFHLRTRRVLDAFDPTKLHIGIRAATTISKSSFIRSHACHKLRAFLSEELRNSGWNWDGTAREPNDEGAKKKRRFGLSGAYLFMINNPKCLTASNDEYQDACKFVVQNMIYDQQPKERKQLNWQDKQRNQQKSLGQHTKQRSRQVQQHPTPMHERRKGV